MYYTLYQNEYADQFVGWLVNKFDVVNETAKTITIDLGEWHWSEVVPELERMQMVYEDNKEFDRLFDLATHNISYACPWI